MKQLETNSIEDPSFVGRWFATRMAAVLPDVPDLAVVGIQRRSRGVSRQTWTVATTIGGRPKSFIVRRDHDAGPVIPTPLRQEFEVYRLLNDTEVPTARALWFEDDPAWQPDGREAYVREEVEGDWYLPFIADDSPEFDERRISASKEHLDKLAIVHRLDWRALGFGEVFEVPAGPEDCARTLVEANLRILQGFQFEPSPVVAEGVAQLLERAPKDAPRVSLCKGTNGHGEEVWSEGRIVAMSDWELAGLTDPAYDFALLQEMIPEITRGGTQIWGLEHALAYYQQESGIEVTLERIDFYRALNGLLQFIYTHHSAHLVQQGGFRDLRFLWTAWENQFRSNVRLGHAFGFSAEGVVNV